MVSWRIAAVIKLFTQCLCFGLHIFIYDDYYLPVCFKLNLEKVGNTVDLYTKTWYWIKVVVSLRP